MDFPLNCQITTKLLDLSNKNNFTVLYALEKRVLGNQDHTGVIVTLLPTNVAPQNSAVGRSHGVESFQNVDMALSFCMCVCVFSLAAAFLFRFVIFNPSLFRNSNLEPHTV